MSTDHEASHKPQSEETSAEHLAKITGESVEEFEYTGDIPSAEDQEWVVADDEQ